MSLGSLRWIEVRKFQIPLLRPTNRLSTAISAFVLLSNQRRRRLLRRRSPITFMHHRQALLLTLAHPMIHLAFFGTAEIYQPLAAAA